MATNNAANNFPPPFMTLVSTTVASNQATVDLTAGLSSAYKWMKIVATGIQLANNGGQALWMRFSNDGGLTYDTGNNYSYNEQFFGSDSNNDWNRSSADGKILVMLPYPDSVTATNSGSLEIDLYNVNSASMFTTMQGLVTANQVAVNYSIRFSGSYNIVTTTSAIRFLGANGNIIAGNFYLYGVN